MQPLPHHYQVQATGHSSDSVTLSSEGLTDIQSAPPAEFDGPGDQWSPETLLLAAVSDCFILSFRAVAAASDFTFTSLDCVTKGTLDRVDRTTRFTEIVNTVTLTMPADGSDTLAHRLLEKAEEVCLISNSLSARIELVAKVVHAD
ncbi:MAG: OsmC family protein [Pseudomonadaceae bacterium]|nr:OsmC family protein [Pseudomonadaceae bacterium]